MIIERWVPGNSRLPSNAPVIIQPSPSPTQLDMDEAYARQLQVQYDQETTITTWSQQSHPVMVSSVSHVVTGVSVVLLQRSSEEDVPVVPAAPSVPSPGSSSQEEYEEVADMNM